MVNAPVRRQQVTHVKRKGISIRRACQLFCVARPPMSYLPRLPLRDEELLREMERLAVKHPRYGYRRVWALLRRAGYAVNPKRVYRLWREHGLSLRRRRKVRRRGPRMERSPVAQRAGEIWAYDFAHDRSWAEAQMSGRRG